MKQFRRNALLINSTLIIVSTTIIGSLLHEYSHFVTAQYFDLNPEFHHNYVSFKNQHGSEIYDAVVAAAGPIFSLVLGLVSLFVSIKLMKPSILKLFFLWLGMNGTLMFAGYLLLAPFVKNGDTGMVFAYFELPQPFSIIVALVFFLTFVVLLKRLAPEFKYYGNIGYQNQKNISHQLFLYPVLISTVLLVIISTPLRNWISLFPIVFIPMTYFSVMKSYEKLNLPEPEIKFEKSSIVIGLLAIIMISLVMVFK